MVRDAGVAVLLIMRVGDLVQWRREAPSPRKKKR
jgi:hypothetical protein